MSVGLGDFGMGTERPTEYVVGWLSPDYGPDDDPADFYQLQDAATLEEARALAREKGGRVYRRFNVRDESAIEGGVLIPSWEWDQEPVDDEEGS